MNPLLNLIGINKAGPENRPHPAFISAAVNIVLSFGEFRSLFAVFARMLMSVHYFLLFFRRCFRISNMVHQINEDIRDKEVRLIGDDGSQLGIMSSQDAMKIAIEKNLDLVKIAPGSNPPVCKIMDYGKYRFEQSKREKETKKNQHIVEVKEIRMSPGIGINDFNVKLKNGMKFLTDGDRLKVTVRFRGREMTHTEIGQELLNRFAEACSEIATVNKNPKLDGRFMTMFLSPKSPTK
jgi:translation initiation factor IF-3